MNNKSIGIIGGGFIGQILKKYYPDAKIYDKYKPLDSLNEVLNQHVIFIAFNLEDNGKETYEEIHWYPEQCKSTGNKIWIVKSTFIPGTCDKLQQDFPHHRFIYNPEFLTEMTAWEDFTKPQFQILGCPYQSLDLVNEIFELLPNAQIKKVISPLDAEVLKHAFNSYYASKVIWFNQLYDSCQKIGVDYETVREIMVQNNWVGNSHSIIYHKGYRGFGGKCLSKDPKIFAELTNNELLLKIIELNEKLRKM